MGEDGLGEVIEFFFSIFFFFLLLLGFAFVPSFLLVTEQRALMELRNSFVFL